MKLKQYILLSVMLQTPITTHASDLLTSLNAATSDLSTAQAALASLLEMIATQINPTDASSTSTEINGSTPTNSTDVATPSSDTTNSSTDTTQDNAPADTNNANSNDTTATDSSSSENSNNENSSGSTTPPDATQDAAPVASNPVVTPAPAQEEEPVMTTAIINNTNQIVYLAMFDKNSQQLNPSNISLDIGAFSYVPSNVITIKVVDSKNQQLGATTAIAQDNHYTITNVKNIWKIAVVTPSAPCTYTNTTTIPVTLTLTAGDTVYSQQIDPQEMYTHTIDASENVAINVHANISGIAASYNPALSYDLTMMHNELSLTPNSKTDKTLTNDTGWPMLITTITSSNVKDEMIVDDNEFFVPVATTISVMVTPLILNQATASAPAKSCSITSKNGQLVLQF